MREQQCPSEITFTRWGWWTHPIILVAWRRQFWAPLKPTLDIDAELPDPDEYEVLIYDQDGRRLVGGEMQKCRR
ncbi:MAG: hypothetical protein O3A00_27310 [Planctomycetota bacterium]|nr:hypothetical protein [Planctomycetota bacterium]